MNKNWEVQLFILEFEGVDCLTFRMGLVLVNILNRKISGNGDYDIKELTGLRSVAVLLCTSNKLVVVVLGTLDVFLAFEVVWSLQLKPQPETKLSTLVILYTI
nr:uncharacterized protein LOC123754911 [Procambarus clarkii]